MLAPEFLGSNFTQQDLQGLIDNIAPLTIGLVPITFCLGFVLGLVICLPFEISAYFLSRKSDKLQERVGQIQSSLNSVREKLRKFPPL